MKERIICCLGILASYCASGQIHTEKISRELSFEVRSADNALIVANLHGKVAVEAYDGDKILIDITRTIKAKTDARLEKGKAAVQVGIMDRADTLIVFVRDGCHEFHKGKGNHTSRSDNAGWNYESVSPHGCSLEYDYSMDFALKVPRTLNIVASTVNNGDVDIENVEGIVKARNINGAIRLSNLKREAHAHTINGDVEISYTENPAKACSFYTLNGDINAHFQPGLSATLGFESFNGSFYTNIASLKSLPPEVEKISEGEGLRYRVKDNTYEVGRGGPLLDFETFNGNVYLKEQ